MGWTGLRNGELLKNAETEFDVFITGDRNLSFQQTISTLRIAVVILHAESTQLHHTLRLMKSVLEVLTIIKPGEIVDIHK
jgi:hypothetical protein